MEENNQLSIKDLAELAIYLYDSGDSAFRQGEFLQARSWFAQSLSVFGQLHAKNAVWIAALLLSLGKIAVSMRELEQASAFFEACSNICEQLPEDDAVKDYRRDLTRLFARINRPETESKMYPTHDFIITSEEVARRKMRITTAGEIEWTILTTENTQPAELGLRRTWKVVPAS